MIHNVNLMPPKEIFSIRYLVKTHNSSVSRSCLTSNFSCFDTTGVYKNALASNLYLMNLGYFQHQKACDIIVYSHIMWWNSHKTSDGSHRCHTRMLIRHQQQGILWHNWSSIYRMHVDNLNIHFGVLVFNGILATLIKHTVTTYVK